MALEGSPAARPMQRQRGRSSWPKLMAVTTQSHHRKKTRHQREPTGAWSPGPRKDGEAEICPEQARHTARTELQIFIPETLLCPRAGPPRIRASPKSSLPEPPREAP